MNQNPLSTPPSALPEHPATDAAERTRPAAGAWIPIRSLAPRHRPRILAHLLSLTPRDRYLRFGYSAGDEQIVHYVETIDFGHDEVFGIFDHELEIIALAHLAYAPAAQPDGLPVVEFGVSIVPAARGRGFGRRLFDHATLHARNRGIETMLIYALSENAPMLRLVRSAGATVERSGSESEARLKLPPDTIGTHVDEAIEQHVAEMDYRWKVQLTQVSGILAAIARLGSRFRRKARTASPVNA